MKALQNYLILVPLSTALLHTLPCLQLLFQFTTRMTAVCKEKINQLISEQTLQILARKAHTAESDEDIKSHYTYNCQMAISLLQTWLL